MSVYSGPQFLLSLQSHAQALPLPSHFIPKDVYSSPRVVLGPGMMQSWQGLGEWTRNQTVSHRHEQTATEIPSPHPYDHLAELTSSFVHYVTKSSQPSHWTDTTVIYFTDEEPGRGRFISLPKVALQGVGDARL